MESPSPPRLTAEAVRRDRGWVWPLAWIMAVPIVTIPLPWWLTGLILKTGACVTHTEFGFISYSFIVCQDSSLLLALGPGVLILAPILWLRSRSRKTRVAAVVATALGSARLVVPAGALLLAGPTQEFGTWFEPNPHFPNENSNAVFAISAGLWLAGVIALAVLALLRPRHADLPDIDSVAGQES